jgi:hypothetical protein
MKTFIDTCSYGIGLVSYFGSSRPFIDMIRQSYTSWYDGLGSGSNTFAENDGWLRNGEMPLPNGHIKLAVNGSDSPDTFTFLRTGTYKLVWNGTAQLTLLSGASYNTHDGAACTEVDIPTGWTNAYTIVVDDPAVNRVTSNIQLIVDLAGWTDLPYSLTEMSMYHIEDEDDFLDGKRYQKDWIKAHEGAKTLRCMDMMRASEFGFYEGLALLKMYDFADLPTENTRLWADVPVTTTGRYGFSACPPAPVLGKLAAECPGLDALWVPIPTAFTKDAIDGYAAGVATTWPAGVKIWIEGGNETPWNFNSPWYSEIYRSASYWAEQCAEIKDTNGVVQTPITFTLSTGDNTITTAADLSGVSDGDAICFLYNGGNAPVTLSDAEVLRHHFMVRKTGMPAGKLALFSKGTEATDTGNETGRYTVAGPAQNYVAYMGEYKADGIPDLSFTLSENGLGAMIAYAYHAFCDELGSANVKIVLAGCVSQTTANTLIPKYVDPVTNQTLASLATYWCVAPYVGAGSSDAMATGFMEDITSLTDVFWTAIYRGSTDYNVTTLCAPTVAALAGDPTRNHLKLIAYEGGDNMMLVRTSRYYFNDDLVNNCITSDVDTTLSWDNGDKMTFFSGQPPVSNNYGPYYIRRRVGQTDAFYLYDTYANAMAVGADDAVTTGRYTIQAVTYLGAENQTRYKAMNDNHKAFMFNNVNNIYQYYIKKTFIDFNYDTFAHYHDLGELGSISQGMSNNPWDIKTRHKYFMSLGSANRRHKMRILSAPTAVVGTLLEDTFTDTDGVLLSDHTMDTGPGWTKIEGAVELEISSNAASTSSTNAGNILYISDSGKADVVITADITLPYNLYYGAAVVFRSVDLNNRWTVWIERDGGTTYLAIYEKTSGTSTLRDTENFSVDPTDSTVTVTVTISGNSITASAANVADVTCSSSVRNTVTTHGFGIYTELPGYIYGCPVDNFKVVSN